MFKKAHIETLCLSSIPVLPTVAGKRNSCQEGLNDDTSLTALTNKGGKTQRMFTHLNLHRLYYFKIQELTRTQLSFTAHRKHKHHSGDNSMKKQHMMEVL
jgi:hypothetical protein